MNNGNYMGRMTNDFTLASSGKMGTGTIAIDRPFPFGKDKDGNQITDFLTLKVIGEDQAKRAEKYLLKGTKIAFTGITCRDTSKDDAGNWKEFNYIMVTGWEFAESKNAQASTPAPKTDSDGFMNVPDGIDEELPFL
jgi:single-strand DNA-binding protein